MKVDIEVEGLRDLHGLRDGEPPSAGDAEAVRGRHHRKQTRTSQAGPKSRRTLHRTRCLHSRWSNGQFSFKIIYCLSIYLIYIYKSLCYQTFYYSKILRNLWLDAIKLHVLVATEFVAICSYELSSYLLSNYYLSS